MSSIMEIDVVSRGGILGRLNVLQEERRGRFQSERRGKGGQF